MAEQEGDMRDRYSSGAIVPIVWYEAPQPIQMPRAPFEILVGRLSTAGKMGFTEFI